MGLEPKGLHPGDPGCRPSPAGQVFLLLLPQHEAGVTYATWSGVGLVVTALISVFIFSEGYNIYTILGIALIVVGVVILNLWGSVGN